MLYDASVKGAFHMNWFKRSIAAAAAACTILPAMPQGVIVPATASDGVFRVSIEQKTIRISEAGSPVPVYVRTEPLQKGWTDYEFGLIVDPACTYTFVEDSAEAAASGGESLDRLTTMIPLSGNGMWLTDSSARTLTGSMNIALLMVKVPDTAQPGDQYAITLNTKNNTGDDAAWCQNRLYSLTYEIEGTDGWIRITDEPEVPTEPSEATAPTEATELSTEPPAEPTASGTCGADLTWVLDPNETLTISGTGAMDDRPDFGDRSKIRQVVIGEGVTSIGAFAFVKCQDLTSVTLPDSLTAISGYAFQSCLSLTSLTIPAGVTSIGSMLFFHCPDPPVIYGYDGTAAQSYAALNGYPFELLDSAPDAAPLAGDADGNGSFGTADLIALQKYLLGIGTLQDPDAADLNGDGIIDVFDLGLMKRLLLSQK